MTFSPEIFFENPKIHMELQNNYWSQHDLKYIKNKAEDIMLTNYILQNIADDDTWDCPLAYTHTRARSLTHILTHTYATLRNIK